MGVHRQRRGAVYAYGHSGTSQQSTYPEEGCVGGEPMGARGPYGQEVAELEGHGMVRGSSWDALPDEKTAFDLSPQELGREGERLAAAYLERQGLVIEERNWTCPRGEADIIARDDVTCVFVEVKTRLQPDGRPEFLPECAVNEAKRERYRGIASCYLALNEYEYARFDVVAVSIVSNGCVHVHHIVDAFGSDF